MKDIKELINTNNNEIWNLKNLALLFIEAINIIIREKNKINNIYREILKIENNTEDKDEKCDSFNYIHDE